MDLYRPDAVCILDFPDELGYMAQTGHAVYGEGAEAFMQWFTTQRQRLKHGSPDAVLEALRRLAGQAKRRGAASAVATIQNSLAYLEKRRALITYAQFQAQSYPIGSGSVESATKVVVESRLKGAGMHWARTHVNPMVALRTMACSDRWAEAWLQIPQEWRLLPHRAVPSAELRPGRTAHRRTVSGAASALAGDDLNRPDPPLLQIYDAHPHRYLPLKESVNLSRIDPADGLARSFLRPVRP